MHRLHNYLAKNIADLLRDWRVVVWYDPREEFRPFVAELRGQPDSNTLPSGVVEHVAIGKLPVALSCFAGSFWAIRVTVEPLVCVDKPVPLLIYVPGVARDTRQSVLKELELGGTTYEPQLKRQARNVLRESYTDGVIDGMLKPDDLSYHDVVALLEQKQGDGQPASILRVIFPQALSNAALVAAWLHDAAADATIAAKSAIGELYQLIGSRLGLTLDVSVPLAEARSRLLRYLLVNEFRADLAGSPPASIGMIAAPHTKDQTSFLREILDRLRKVHPDFYVETADKIEQELGLATAGIDPLVLGAIDTFRFEEQALLARCDALIATGDYAEASRIEVDRGRSFWTERDVLRQLQWNLCRLVLELRQTCQMVETELDQAGKQPAAWVIAYARDGGWHLMDQQQRRLETLLANLDEEPVVPKAVARVREAHDRLAQRMAEGFTKVLRAASWHIADMRSQTHIYHDHVAPRLPAGPLAYFLVDSLRFEMGQELTEQLQPQGEIACVPAITALPSITKIGMAALLPGAATSFSVEEVHGKLAAVIDGTALPDIGARLKFFRARVPKLVDLELGALLQTNLKALTAQIKDASLVLVRSQEIDSLGESGASFQARQVMDTAIANVARAVRKLVLAGVGQFVIAADHGHLFAGERGDDMKTESPGGNPIELHRRCWVGRGGKTPSGAVRVSGAELGYATDLDFIFPTGLGVFKAGGDLAYHHGGLSLQELVVPVVTLRVPKALAEPTSGVTVIISGAPEALHNRTLGVTLTLVGSLLTEPTTVRPVLVAGGEQVGYAGMAQGGEFNRQTQCVTLTPGAPVSVGMMLTRDDILRVRIIVQDPISDAVLAQTDEIPVQLGM